MAPFSCKITFSPNPRSASIDEVWRFANDHYRLFCNFRTANHKPRPEMERGVRFEHYVEINTKTERRLTIAWKEDPDKPGHILYGSSMFKKPCGDHTGIWVKKQHRLTARERLRKHPVSVEMTHAPSIMGKPSTEEFHKELRRCVMKHGVSTGVHQPAQNQ